MNEKNERMVQISVEEYRDLVLTESRYHTLLDALLDTTELRIFPEDELTFVGYRAEDALKILEPFEYKYRVADLKQKAALAAKAAEKAAKSETVDNPL